MSTSYHKLAKPYTNIVNMVSSDKNRFITIFINNSEVGTLNIPEEFWVDSIKVFMAEERSLYSYYGGDRIGEVFVFEDSNLKHGDIFISEYGEILYLDLENKKKPKLFSFNDFDWRKKIKNGL